jgi:hypothetical protein
MQILSTQKQSLEEKDFLRGLEKFEELCVKYPDIVQEMAENRCIINHEVIRICQKNGIKFSHELLLELGFIKPNGKKSQDNGK